MIDTCPHLGAFFFAKRELISTRATIVTWQHAKAVASTTNRAHTKAAGGEHDLTLVANN
jgi:hypothetical protein